MPDFSRISWKVKPGVNFKCALTRPSIPLSDVYIDMEAEFPYIKGLNQFLLSKNIKTAAFVKDAEYDANCVVLVRMGTKVKGDAVVFYLNEDKAELWNFLKERFKGRL